MGLTSGDCVGRVRLVVISHNCIVMLSFLCSEPTDIYHVHLPRAATHITNIFGLPRSKCHAPLQHRLLRLTFLAQTIKSLSAGSDFKPSHSNPFFSAKLLHTLLHASVNVVTHLQMVKEGSLFCNSWVSFFLGH